RGGRVRVHRRAAPVGRSRRGAGRAVARGREERRRRIRHARHRLTRALVLGGAGFIGVAACKELMRRGVETIAAGRKERPYGTFTSYVAFDRTDEDQLVRALGQTPPDGLRVLACCRPG